MARQTSNYKKILKLLESLHVKYPTFGLGRHIETVRESCGDMWALSDKELLYQLEKYEAELELDNFNIASPDYVDKVIKGAQDLDTLMKDIDGYEEE